MTTTMNKRSQAELELLGFTIAAAATGAIPVPATSAAIVAENAVMMTRVASTVGVPVSVATVTSSLGFAGTANITGRLLFVEAARAVGWFAGPLGVAGVSALGAFTAGLQTWVLGQLVIAICESGGSTLPRQRVAQVMEEADAEYRSEVWERVRNEV